MLAMFNIHKASFLHSQTRACHVRHSSQSKELAQNLSKTHGKTKKNKKNKELHENLSKTIEKTKKNQKNQSFHTL